MRTRRQKILEDRQAVVGQLNAGENSLQIPVDLIFEILLRLPIKCVARCRCLSKLWASIIDRQDFTDQYLKISSARPQLLFAFQDSGKVFFFSAPQDQETDNSSPITASYHMSFPVNRVREIYSPISAKNGADSSTYGKDVIVSFDVRSEKFGFIEVDKRFNPVHTLINFNGKLASVEYYSFNRRYPIHLWVLDDIEKNEWSKHVYKLPASWEDVVGDADLYCVKVTASNEVVLSGYNQRSPFYVFYYSPERETVRRDEIKGMEAFTHSQVCTFVDHVEDVKRLKGVLGLALK
ncbi:hypothetical protein Bca101_012526 [Brassica carinata]